MTWYNGYFKIKFNKIIRQTPKAYLIEISEDGMQNWVPKVGCKDVNSRTMTIKGWLIKKNPSFQHYLTFEGYQELMGNSFRRGMTPSEGDDFEYGQGGDGDNW